MDIITRHILNRAKVTPQQLALSRALDERNDQTFAQDSSAMHAIVEVMANSTLPAIQQATGACSTGTNNGTATATTPGTTMYHGFHLEGGGYDGSFSILVAIADIEPKLTFLRG